MRNAAQFLTIIICLFLCSLATVAQPAPLRIVVITRFADVM